MKKILTTLAVAGLTSAVFAQGTVNWNGSGSSLIVQTNSSVYSSFSPSLAGTARSGGSTGNTLGNTAAINGALGYAGYYYELLVSTTAAAAPTTVAGLSGWLDTTLGATNSSASNGRIIQTSAGGAGGVAGNQQATASNWPAGTTESVILAGWSANLGSTWGALETNMVSAAYLNALNSPGYFGVSAIGSLASASGNPGVTVFGSNPGQINGAAGSNMVLEPLAAVPEPGTLALAALGGASLLLFRRKK